jgi:hypothetical protein
MKDDIKTGTGIGGLEKMSGGYNLENLSFINGNYVK